MAIILLVSVTAIACNMEKVVKEPTKENGEVVTTKKFNGKTVVIDPGHGGDDPGKIGVNKEKEKDVNLAISTLLSSGFSSILIAQSFFQPPDCFICPICRRDC